MEHGETATIKGATGRAGYGERGRVPRGASQSNRGKHTAGCAAGSPLSQK